MTIFTTLYRSLLTSFLATLVAVSCGSAFAQTATEQQLWMSTAEASPDINKIEAKTKEIGELNANKRIEFIRAVGKATEVLTAAQRQALVGMTALADTKTDE